MLGRCCWERSSAGLSVAMKADTSRSVLIDIAAGTLLGTGTTFDRLLAAWSDGRAVGAPPGQETVRGPGRRAVPHKGDKRAIVADSVKLGDFPRMDAGKSRAPPSVQRNRE
jgi:hypothetical protein